MLFCGIDIGTTRTKACLLDEDLNVIGRMEAPAGRIRAGRVDANSWFQGFCDCLAKFKSTGALKNERLFCSITAQGGSFAILDNKYHPAAAGFSWTGLSRGRTVEQLKAAIEPGDYYKITGWLPDRWLMACKLKEFFGGRVGKRYKFVSTVPEFILARLTGKFITDITNAQITGLCDFRKGLWSDALLDWAGVSADCLPAIESKLSILAQDVRTEWGKSTFATSSHDQYAAMEAAGLRKDRSLMLATGTAWVLTGRTRQPVFDKKTFLIYPGRDLRADCFGFIVGLGQIGTGLERTVRTTGGCKDDLARLQENFDKADIPDGPVNVDVARDGLKWKGGGVIGIRRYMEWAASRVYFLLEKLNLARNLDQITMTGGAAGSSFWAQAIADIAGIKVRAIDFPQFTALGAALHAKAAFSGQAGAGDLPGQLKQVIFNPKQLKEYRRWYRDCQRPVFEKAFG